jgi:HYR domain
VLLSGGVSGQGFAVGVNTICYRVTDGCGNTASCCFTVTVTATPPPVSILTLVIPANKSIGCDAAAVLGTATATTTCQSAAAVNITSVDQAAGTPCAGRSLTRTFTATDACGNQKTGVQVITIAADNAAPSFASIPNNVQVPCTSALPAFGTASATDLCSSVVVSSIDLPVTGSCALGYTFRRVFTATDACGNTATAQQEMTTLPDNTGPVFTSLPPTDQMITCGAPIQLGSATATDACSPGVTITQLITNNGASACNTVNGITYGYDLYVRWIATDACGNVTTANTNIWVLPSTNIAFLSKPDQLQVACNEPIAWNEPMPKSFMGDIIDISHSDKYDLDACGAGLITRTWVATDALGNTCVAEQVATRLRDVLAPVLVLDMPILSMDCSNAIPMLAPKVTDNCASQNEIVLTHSDQYFVDQIERTWTAIDPCGNQYSVVQTILKTDITPPVFGYVPVDEVLSCGDLVVFGIAIATDACQLDAVSYIDGMQIQPCAEIYTRTWTATDKSGNNSTVKQTITLLDKSVPVFTSSLQDKTILCGDALVFDLVTASDACQVSTILVHADRVTVPSCGGTGDIGARRYHGSGIWP